MARPPGSILIVRLSALGDVIHVLPSLAALRRAFPEAKLGWAVEELAAPLLEGHPELDRLHVIPRKAWQRDFRRGALLAPLGAARRKLSELRGERYEVAIDFQSNLRSAIVTRLSGAPRRIGQPPPFAREGAGRLFTDTPRALPAEAHKIERNLALLACLGLSREPQRGSLPGAARDVPPRDDRARVVLHSGVSAHGAIKAWRPERFRDLAAKLVADGHEVVLCWGGDSERRQAEHLAAEAAGARLAPESDAAGLAALLRSADLFIGVDSGPLHLAAALGTPVIGLYGPKHPGTYGPYWLGTEAVLADYPCSPCRHRKCPRPEVTHVELADGGRAAISPCMDTISVDAVHARATALLAKGNG